MINEQLITSRQNHLKMVNNLRQIAGLAPIAELDPVQSPHLFPPGSASGSDQQSQPKRGEAIILRNWQSPGDIVMLTAAVRELSRQHPGRFRINIDTSAGELWENNPYLDRTVARGAGVRVIECGYNLIHRSNQSAYHFIHGFAQDLEDKLDVRIRMNEFRGDIHMTDAEKSFQPVAGFDVGKPYWIVDAGCKLDFTAKLWNPEYFQAVVDHFASGLQFVQIGAAEHFHPELNGVVNLVGKTSMRDLIRLVHHSLGVLTPVSLPMHLAAAVPTRPDRPRIRACVVIAGGREPSHWERYPGHDFIDTIGKLECCADGGCWKNKAWVPPGDQDKSLCVNPLELTVEGWKIVGGERKPAGKLRVAKCMEMIKPESVAGMIERNIEAAGGQVRGDGIAWPSNNIVEFRHGLGDCAQFARVLLACTFRGDPIPAVSCDPNKVSFFHAWGLRTTDGRGTPIQWLYGEKFNQVGKYMEDSNKVKINLPLLPFVRDVQGVWDSVCAFDSSIVLESRQEVAPCRPAGDWQHRLEGLPEKLVLFHPKGTNFAGQKNLSDDLIEQVQRGLANRGYGVVVLDWDSRVKAIDHPNVKHLSEFGQVPANEFLALIEYANLFIGVDSGPLHTAMLSRTPTLGVFTQLHPVAVCLPPPRGVNLCPRSRQNEPLRVKWSLIDYERLTYDVIREAAEDLIDSCFENPAHHGMVRNLIRLCEGRQQSYLAILLHACEAFRRGNNTTIVETGSLRDPGNFAGDGQSTLILAMIARATGGRLVSIDIDGDAQTRARCYLGADLCSVVDFIAGDSGKLLREIVLKYRPSVVMLDSLDYGRPGSSLHCDLEFSQLKGILDAGGILAIDDTAREAKSWRGKGETVAARLEGLPAVEILAEDKMVVYRFNTPTDT